MADVRGQKARRLRIIGIAGLVAAVLFLFAAGWVPAVALAILGVGNLLAAGPVASTGLAPLPVRLMIIIGGLGFVVSIVVTMINMAGVDA